MALASQFTRARLTPLLLIGAGLLLTPVTTQAGPVGRRQAGANPAAIQAAVDQFRADLGGALNPNTPGAQPTGRREINWDGVPDAFSAPQNFPGTFFNVNSPRGAVFTTPGTGFQLSMDNDTPTDPDPDLVDFGHFSAAYATAFVTFSPQRLFAPIGSTVTDVTFRVPGSNRPASVSGFGVIFTDVDVFGATTVEFFDEKGARLPVADDDTKPFVANNGLSFLGVSFNAGERIARVRITMGEVDLATGGVDGVAGDAVAMDDFIYGEPQAITTPSHLDSTFGTGGWTTVNFGNTDQAEAVLVQADGKIVAAGTWDGGAADFAVLRLNADGTRDTTFSGDGRANLTFGAGTFGGVERSYGIARQPDGKYVVVGVTDAGGGNPNNFAIARLNVDGTLDTTFDGDGKKVVDFGFEDQAHAVAIQADGKIVVVGQAASDVAVLRLNPNGSLDTTFNDVPVPTAENGDGIYRFTLAGTDFARAVAMQPDGAIVIAGATTGPGGTDMVAIRLLPTGQLDPAFSDDGWIAVDFTWAETGEAVIVLPDGRLLVGGSADGGSADFAAIRLLANGTLDPSFNPGGNDPSNFNGQFRTSFGNADFLMAMALQGDGKVVLAGYTSAGGGTPQNVAVARLTAEGAADTTFGPNGRQILELEADEAAYGVAIQTDARIVLAGRRGGDFLVARLVGGPAPNIQITTPETEAPTTSTQPFASIKGLAGDDVAVTSVTWSTNRGFAGTATGTTAWSAEVALAAGVNVITVTATDANGNTATDTVTVTVSEFVYYLSEGATGQFFDMDILLANPTATPADVAISYLKPDGTTVAQAFALGANTRRTVRVDDIPGLTDTAVSAVIRSTNGVPLAVERSMFWDASYYGGHTGNAVDAPRTQWLFAEGSQGFFDTYVLLANANAVASQVTITFLVEGAANVTKVYDIAATSRLNVYTGLIPELVGRSFSMVVTSTLPVTAERAMYFGTRLFEGGHESAGVPEGATSWFHAEGATGTFFDTYILLGNPNATPASVTMTYLTDAGQSIVRNKVVAANSRLTVYVDAEDAALAAAAVSTTVTSDLPIISERAMYWAGEFTNWFEAHNSFGVTSTGTRWALAEGRVGGAPGFGTFVLIANPSAVAADVRATFMRSNGTTVVKTYTVNPTSRFNIWVNNDVPELANQEFGVLIEVLNGVNVAVERAMYWRSGGVDFAGGTNATAVRVP